MEKTLNKKFTTIHENYVKEKESRDQTEEQFISFIFTRLHNNAEIIQAIYRKKQKNIASQDEWARYIPYTVESFKQRFEVNKIDTELNKLVLEYKIPNSSEVKTFNVPFDILFKSNRAVAKITRQRIYYKKYYELKQELNKIEAQNKVMTDERIKSQVEDFEKKKLAELRKLVKEEKTRLLKEQQENKSALKSETKQLKKLDKIFS